jgi:hypothetical protein
MDACIFTAPLTKFLNAYSFLDQLSATTDEIRATSGGNGTSVFTREFAPGLFQMWGGNALATGSFLGAQSLATGAFYNRRTTSRRNTPTKGLTGLTSFARKVSLVRKVLCLYEKSFKSNSRKVSRTITDNHCSRQRVVFQIFSGSPRLFSE